MLFEPKSVPHGRLESWISRAWLRAGSFTRLLKKTDFWAPRRGAIYVRQEQQSQSTKTAIIIGALAAVLALILLSCLLWLFLRRRKEAEDKERSLDLISRPFPLNARPGKSRLPAIRTQVSPPVFVPKVTSPARARRKVFRPRDSAPTEASTSTYYTRRSSTAKSVLDRWILPPISQGYGFA
ncbi:hypothetical protein C8R46DRAFT_1106719, partial [Mycena filopes]